MNKRDILKQLVKGEISINRLLMLIGEGRTAVISGDTVTIHYKNEMNKVSLEEYEKMKPIRGLFAQITIINPCPPVLSEDDIVEPE